VIELKQKQTTEKSVRTESEEFSLEFNSVEHMKTFYHSLGKLIADIEIGMTIIENGEIHFCDDFSEDNKTNQKDLTHIIFELFVRDLIKN
jgi:hypothetical protein